MYLKSIEIHGFKSFANKIKFEFHNGITGIVGPNGSGKSNVADAVRWVLGEQKIKQLRGDRMEDVIFSGTENRKPMGYAYVAITFDNSDRKLNLDYSEVTVSRRLYRSGESEYILNGTQVRLRDINELFYDTGIGKEGYSIIGQGQIDKIISGKPEERRALFDEAAGIVKFKRRKNEALKKLDDENQNLTRVGDILSELERQVGPLEKQSTKAKRYLELKDDLKINEVNMYLLDVEEFDNKLDALDEKISIAERDLSSQQADFEEIKENYSKLENIIEKIDISIDEKKNKISSLALETEKTEGRINVINEQINSAKNNESFFAGRIESISKDINSLSEGLESLIDKKNKNEKMLLEATNRRSDLSDKIGELRENSENLSNEIEDHKEKIIQNMNKKSDIKSRLKECDTLLEQINLRKEKLMAKIGEFERKSSHQDEEIRELEEQLKKSENDLSDVEQKEHEYTEKLNLLREDRTRISDSISANQESYHKNRSNLEALQSITERYEGYGSSIQRVMELKKTKKGIVGVVADIIKVEKEYETAIETALGGNIQNIVTDTETTAKDVIEYLKKNKYGRATFLPLTSMSRRIEFNMPEALGEEGVVGLASDLVNTDSKYEGVVRYLLGRVMVVDNIDNAIRIERRYKYRVRIVTLEGEYLNIGGSISGGKYKKADNLLGRRREIDELNCKLRELETEKSELQKSLDNNNSEVSVYSEKVNEVRSVIQEQRILKNTIELNLDRAREEKENTRQEYRQYNEENADIEERIKNIGDSSESLNIELTGTDERNNDLQSIIEADKKKLEEVENDLSQATKELEDINIEIAGITQGHEYIVSDIEKQTGNIETLKKELETIKTGSDRNDDEISQKTETIEELKKSVKHNRELTEKLNGELKEAYSEKDKQNAEHREFFQKREELSERISDLDKEVFRLTSQKTSIEEKKSARESYIWENYELTYRGAYALKNQDDIDKSALKNRIDDIKKEIKSLGDVSVNAIDEFREVNERYLFMKGQHDDLMEARDNLLKIIDELETGMRRQFKEKLEEIKIEFNNVFQELFGGGKGTIELTDSEDILEAGINIISQPPGKKLQNMMQLSGGEKALTAICLLFAIQNLKPSPFCLLDEIEAALDGSNVVRFAEYLHKLTRYTQFIVITHRRGTMGCADRLYGITMQEKGVSALVSVDLLEKDLDK